MSTIILTSLEITAAGMGLVFIAILLLWLLMWLISFFRLAEKKELANNDEAKQSAKVDPHELEAVAVAVSAALQEHDQSTAHPFPQPPTALISAWQLGMRTRQMYEKGGKEPHK